MFRGSRMTVIFDWLTNDTCKPLNLSDFCYNPFHVSPIPSYAQKIKNIETNGELSMTNLYKSIHTTYHYTFEWKDIYVSVNGCFLQVVYL